MGPRRPCRIQPPRIQILAAIQILAVRFCLRTGCWPTGRGDRNVLVWGTLVLLGGLVSYSWGGLPRIDPSGERIFLPPSEADRADRGLFRSGDNIALLLTPREVAAPIGTELILVATVVGPDNYTSTNEEVQWSIPGGSVGEFVQVGKGTWVDWLLLDFTRPRKISNTFAVTSTLRRNVRLTRGTPDVQDDVVIQPGQTWVSVSSPVEGTTYVSALAPSVGSWTQRRQTAVIHWVDAQWTFPPPAINPAGGRHRLTTTVTGRSDGRPRPGWLVRYEILDGPPAGFSPDGAKIVEVATNAVGQASVEIFQPQPAAGVNRIQMHIFRPNPGGGPESPRLLLASGITTSTWSAPQLALRKVGPSLVALGSLVQYTMDVWNPGDLLAEGVRLVDQVPEGATFLSSNPPAQISGNLLQWDLGTLGPGQSRRVEVTLRADRAGVWSSCAEATSLRGLRAQHCTSTTVTATPAGVTPPSTPVPGGSAGVELSVSGPTQAVVGQQVRFDILLVNRGNTAATGLVLRDRFGPGFRHETVPGGVIERPLSDLAPGAEQRYHVIFQVVQSGQVCHSVELYSHGQRIRSQEVCLQAVGAGGQQETPPAGSTAPSGPAPSPTTPSAQPPPPASASAPSPKGTPLARGPALAVRSWSEPTKATVGQRILVLSEIQNTGTEILQGVRIAVRHDPQLRPTMATEGFRREADQLIWVVDQIQPGNRLVVQVQYECVQGGTQVCSYSQATTLQGAQGAAQACLSIEPGPGAGLRGPELAFQLTALKDPATVGDNVTYRITVTNQGQKSDFQVILAVGLSNQLLPHRIGTSGPAPWEIQGQTIQFAPVREIRPGETLTYRIVALARTAGEAEVVARLQSQSLPQPQTATQKTRIQPKGN